MFMRIEKLQIELPIPENPDPKAAAAVQELMGGRFGEMSTLMNYMFQSHNFRQRDKARPFYDLVASITAEELGHVELVAATINLLLSGSADGSDPEAAPLFPGSSAPNPHHYIVNAQTAIPGNSLGQPWQGDYVFNSGNLKLDLLHNFFLECGARTHKMRVYEMTTHPVARRMIGYLLVRGGTHVVAYARALEKLTGVEVTKMLPIPDLDNKPFTETRQFIDQGLDRFLYRFSPNDYKQIEEIWNGPNPQGEGNLEVLEGTPEGAPIPVYPAAQAEFAPSYDPDAFAYVLSKMG
jgi:Mn-containing catalase